MKGSCISKCIDITKPAVLKSNPGKKKKGFCVMIVYIT